jgi:hypothetical protein
MRRLRPMEAAPGMPRGAAPRGLAEEDTMQPRRLTHTIGQMERICPRCWAVSTQTEDGHRFTAFGVTRKQAIYRAHQKAKAYGRYAYPTAAEHERRNMVRMPYDQEGHVRDGCGESVTAPIERASTPVEIVQPSGATQSRAPRTR